MKTVRWSVFIFSLALVACSGGGKGAPVLSGFSANPARLTKGSEVTFSWSAKGAMTLTLNPGARTVTGSSVKVRVWQDTTFTLTARNAAGETTAKTDVTFDVPAFSSSIDAAVQPQQPTLEGRDLAALVDADGLQSDFVLDEVRIAPRDAAELQAFLTRTGGTVIGDDSVPAPPASFGLTLTAEQRAAQEYLVHLDGSTGNVTALADEARKLGIGGVGRFSSERAQRFFALVTHEAVSGVRVQPNFMEYPSAVPFSSSEAPKAGGGNIDAFDAAQFPAFSNMGSKASVVQAWQWLGGVILTRRPRVAIIDSGFWLNPDGSPMSVPGVGSDFVGTPPQWDFVGSDGVADGPNAGSCGANACPWHGNSAAGVAVGAVNNSAGAAGTGGTIADPILFRIDYTMGRSHSAVKSARFWGADVVSMSYGGVCNLACRQYDRDDDVFSEAAGAGVVLVAAAGNSNLDVSTQYYHPCINGGVICVGALNNGTNTRIGYSDYGGQVAIWAPTNIPDMPNGGQSSVGSFGGTSASTPFIAGIAAMMRAVDPGLVGSDVQRILHDTAWTDSTDSRVDHYVNALRAVQTASGFHLRPDRLESNQDEGTASLLPNGLTENLTIDWKTDRDFFKFDVPTTSNVFIDVMYPPAIGNVYTYNGGVQVTQGCGFGELITDTSGPKGRSLWYRLPTGHYSFPLVSTNAVPYDVQMSKVSQGGAAIPPDSYEPNNTYATRTNMGDGKVVRANLHNAADVDYFTFYSQGDFDTAFITLTSQIKLLESDMPLTLTVYDSSGAFFASATTGETCSVKPKIAVQQGFYTVGVTGSSAGNYALWMGATASQHGVLDIDKLLYAIFNPGDPIEFIVHDPREWVEAVNNSDYRTAGFHMMGSDVHVTVYTEAGVKVGEGTPRVKTAQSLADGEDVLLPAESVDKRFILQLDRVVGEGSTVPASIAIPITLSLQAGGI